MRRAAILASLLVNFLTGCATLSESDRLVLQRKRVSPDVTARMIKGDRISLTDIIELSERDIPAPFLVRYLRSTAAVYTLNSSDVLLLRRAGVSRTVVDYLLQTPVLFAPAYDPFWQYDDPFWWNSPPLIVPRYGYAHRGKDRHDRHHRRR